METTRQLIPTMTMVQCAVRRTDSHPGVSSFSPHAKVNKMRIISYTVPGLNHWTSTECEKIAVRWESGPYFDETEDETKAAFLHRNKFHLIIGLSRSSWYYLILSHAVVLSQHFLSCWPLSRWNDGVNHSVTYKGTSKIPPRLRKWCKWVTVFYSRK